MLIVRIFTRGFIVSSMLIMTAHAQQEPPDISGVWGAQLLFSLSDDPPLLPDAAQAFNTFKPESDPLAICKPPGPPRLMNTAFQFEIVQTQKVIYFLMEYGQHVRRIFMNAAHPADIEPTWLGHSIGHWEGRTLVVDTVGFNGLGWLDQAGHPQSDALHLTERYTLSADGRSLRHENIIDDPETYSRPWQSVTKTYPRATGPILEYICETI